MTELARDTLAESIEHSQPSGDLPSASQEISGGTVTLALRGRGVAA